MWLYARPCARSSRAGRVRRCGAIDDQDFVGLRRRRQAVGDDDGGAASHSVRERP
jgi:hypothetical protein